MAAKKKSTVSDSLAILKESRAAEMKKKDPDGGKKKDKIHVEKEAPKAEPKAEPKAAPKTEPAEVKKEKKPSLLCPKCGKPLARRIEPGQGMVFGHESGRCKIYYRTKKEIEEAREGKEAASGAETQVEKMDETISGDWAAGEAPAGIGNFVSNIIEEEVVAGKEEPVVNKKTEPPVEEPEEEMEEDIEITATITQEEYDIMNGTRQPAAEIKVENTEEVPPAGAETGSSQGQEETEISTSKENSPSQPATSSQVENINRDSASQTPEDVIRPEAAEKDQENSTLEKEPAGSAMPAVRKGLRKELLHKTKINEEEVSLMEEKRINVIQKEVVKYGPEGDKDTASEKKPERTITTKYADVKETKTEKPEPEYGKTQLLNVKKGAVKAGIKHPTLTEIETGDVVEINKPVFLVGCKGGAGGCDYVIEDDPVMHTVSRKHAQFVLKNETVYIKDLSSNGTFIGRDDQEIVDYFRLPPETEVELKDGQIVMFATRCYLFRREV